MNYETVYSYEWFTIVPLFFFISLIFLIGIFFIFNLKNPYVKSKVLHLIFSIILLVVSGVLLFNIIVNSIVLYRNIYIPYQSGEFVTVEGEVHEFDPASFEPLFSFGTDRFTVNGIPFSVGNSEMAGLRKNAANGGPIYEEGQIVLIGYITLDGINYIVRVDVPVDE